MVEGQARFRLREDPAHNCIGISKDIRCSNPERPDTRAAQPRVTRFVPLRPISSIVRLAIDFDRQSGIAAEKIEI
jgi:hypothetical protein